MKSLEFAFEINSPLAVGSYETRDYDVQGRQNVKNLGGDKPMCSLS